MVPFSVGDEVKVQMPEGQNLRGVHGVHLMFTTSPEAKFEGSIGVVKEIRPEGGCGIPLFLVDFRQHDNPWIPWQAQWFRESWLERTSKPGVGSEPTEEAVTPPDPVAGPVHQ